MLRTLSATIIATIALVAPGVALAAPPLPPTNITASAGYTPYATPGDQTPPEIELTAPQDGATVTGTVPIAVTVSDDMRVSSVGVWVDGLLVGSSTAAPFAFDWDTTPFSNGEHTITVTAFDWHGNQTTRTTRVTIDNPASSGLVAAYGFEHASGTAAADAARHGNTGFVRGATWTPTGRFGRALSFDGSNDSVDLPALGTFYRRAFTLEAWLKKTGAKRDVAAVGSWAGGTLGGPMLWVDHLSGRWTQTLAKGAATYLDSGYLPVTGAWQHLAATYDGFTARFYLDGVEVASRPFSRFEMGSTDLWKIGAYGPGPVGFFDGVIDEVRIYRRALTAAEIAVDMATPADSAAPPPATPPAAPANLTATGSLLTATLDWDGAEGASFYDVYRSETPGFVPAPGSRIARVTETAYTDGDRAPGTYYYRVTARNASGDEGPPSSEARAEVAPDVTPPQVQIEQPSADAAVRGHTLLQARVTDDVRVTSVEFAVDGGSLGEGTRSGDIYTRAFDAAQVANGEHRLVVIARDAAGNEATREVVFRVDKVPPPPGLVAAYGFDDGSGTSATDDSGRGLHGTLEGAPTWTAGGMRGAALSFDGIDDRVNLPELGFGFLEGFTFEAWVNKTTAKTDVGIVGQWSSLRGGGPMIWVDHVAGRYRLTTERDLSGYLDSGVAPAIGRWQHVAATYDGSVARFYVDGVEVASRPVAMFGLGQYWRIGAYGPGHEGYFEGLIDDVKIYSRPLSPAEIAADRDGTGGEEPPSDTTPPTAPGDLAVARATTVSIALRWSAATDETGVARYAVYRDGTLVDTTAERTFTVDRLECGTAYRFTVEARDAAGNGSPPAVLDTSTAGCVMNGLVAAYSLEHDARDDSPNGRDGTLVGTSPVAGRYGQARWFAGSSSSRVDLPALGTFYRTGLTLEAWVRRDAVSATIGNDAIVGTWVTGEGGGPMLWVDTVDRRYRLTIGKSMTNYLDSGRSPVDDQWQHLAATWDGRVGRFYVDGAEVANRTYPAGTQAGDSNTWRIGGYTGTSVGFRGAIDEVRIYRRPLTPAEVVTDMQTPIIGAT